MRNDSDTTLVIYFDPDLICEFVSDADEDSENRGHKNPMLTVVAKCITASPWPDSGLLNPTIKCKMEKRRILDLMTVEGKRVAGERWFEDYEVIQLL